MVSGSETLSPSFGRTSTLSGLSILVSLAVRDFGLVSWILHGQVSGFLN